VSRGPGKWQRLILDALQENEFVVIRDLLPKHAKRSERCALYRAARKLYKQNKIDLWKSKRYIRELNTGEDMHIRKMDDTRNRNQRFWEVAFLPTTELPYYFYKNYAYVGKISCWVSGDVHDWLMSIKDFEEAAGIARDYGRNVEVTRQEERQLPKVSIVY